jgi:hypothetical protein
VVIRLAEVGVAASLLFGTAALAVLTASSVRGQAVPGAPSSPPRPPSPGAPATPGAPAAAGVHGLSLALLEINAGTRSADRAVLDVGRALVEVAGRQGRRTGDAHRLAGLLVAALDGRRLAEDAGRSLATALAGSLMASAREDLDAALRQVEDALHAAGVAGPALILIETELRRIAVPAR